MTGMYHNNHLGCILFHTPIQEMQVCTFPLDHVYLVLNFAAVIFGLFKVKKVFLVLVFFWKFCFLSHDKGLIGL